MNHFSLKINSGSTQDCHFAAQDRTLHPVYVFYQHQSDHWTGWEVSEGRGKCQLFEGLLFPILAAIEGKAPLKSYD